MHMTVGLAIITNTGPEIRQMVADYFAHFDKFYITVADKNRKLYTELNEFYKSNPKVELSYFKWVDHFGKARLYNQSQIKTDYWMWIDSDDTIEGVQHIRTIVQDMYDRHLSAMMLPYKRDVTLWRERIMKTSPSNTWRDVPCHETVSIQGTIEQSSEVVIRHHKTPEQYRQSVQRNQKLLEKDWIQHKTPDTAFYLGKTYAFQQNYGEALKMFQYTIENSSSDEQKLFTWLHAVDCFSALGQLDRAMFAIDRAHELDPNHPEPWYLKAIYYAAQGVFDQAGQFAETAMAMEPPKTTLVVYDPEKFKYWGLFVSAQANLHKGNIDEAYKLYQEVKKAAPHIIEQQYASGKRWDKVFEEAYRQAHPYNSSRS